MSSGVRDHAGLSVCAAGIGCFIALIGHGLGYVLSEVGSVAPGGPYALARPAPALIMILPVSIILLLASVGVPATQWLMALPAVVAALVLRRREPAAGR